VEGGGAVKTEWRANPRLVRFSIALVWFYQGLWCKVLGGSVHHLAVISAVPVVGPAAGRIALVGVGLVECGLGAWVMAGKRLDWAAVAQTALLVAMNAAGLIWAWRLIPDPVGMILQNFVFVLLIWTAVEVDRHVATA
jgi:hypothetical protein